MPNSFSLVSVLAALLLAAGPLAAQGAAAPLSRDSTGQLVSANPAPAGRDVEQAIAAAAATLLPRAGSLPHHPASPEPPVLHRLRRDAVRQSNRVRHAVIGGLIGGATGLIVCTVISNITKDDGTGISTCTTDGYVGFGLGGFAAGAIIGAVVK